MRTIALSWLLLSALAGAARAFGGSENAGTSAAEFLKLGVGARGIAMGSAMGAAADDATALYWNPAGLSQAERQEVSISGGRLFQDVSFGFAAYARPVKPIVQPRRRFLRPSGLGTLAIGIIYANAGRIPEYDRFGDSTGGAVTPRDLAVLAGWGATLTDRFDLGVALKYIDSKIASSARTGALDVGMRWRTDFAGWPWVLAFSGHNLGGELRFRDQGDPLPASFRLGQTLRPMDSWLLSLDVVQPRDNDLYPAFGTEIAVAIDSDLRAIVRGGWSGRTASGDLDGMAGISFGAGVAHKGMDVGYAWAPFGALGSTHRFSFAFRWGK